ncbi:hypothetical protein [Paraburkholderia elongata]|uniref:hypothetical protein n=1 Tax=Paraburkholderia elongata TaxID=2675747 RepID=UPI001C130788|nr:hypothetical protein [Paraburkholderia elongata]
MRMIAIARKEGRRQTNLALQIEVKFVEEAKRKCIAIVVQMPGLRMEFRGGYQVKLLQPRMEQTYTADYATAGEGHMAFSIGFEGVVFSPDGRVDTREQISRTFALALVHDLADDAVKPFVE